MKRQLTFGRIVSYLLYLTIVCTLIFGVTYARYSTEVTGSASARTAAVALDSSLDLTDKLEGMQPGENKEISFTVSNQKDEVTSEVAQGYTITLLTTGNLPLTFEIVAVSSNNGQNYGLTQEEGKYIWSGGILPAGIKTEHTYKLSVIWPENENDPKYMSEIDAVSLRIDAQQIKPAAVSEEEGTP